MANTALSPPSRHPGRRPRIRLINKIRLSTQPIFGNGKYSFVMRSFGSYMSRPFGLSGEVLQEHPGTVHDGPIHSSFFHICIGRWLTEYTAASARTRMRRRRLCVPRTGVDMIDARNVRGRRFRLFPARDYVLGSCFSVPRHIQ